MRDNYGEGKLTGKRRDRESQIPFAPKHHKCVTCGKMSVNYRCDKCKREWLGKHNLSPTNNLDDDWAEMA